MDNDKTLIVASQILSGMLANPEIVKGEIFWDALHEEAVDQAIALAQQVHDTSVQLG